MGECTYPPEPFAAGDGEARTCAAEEENCQGLLTDHPEPVPDAGVAYPLSAPPVLEGDQEEPIGDVALFPALGRAGTCVAPVGFVVVVKWGGVRMPLPLAAEVVRERGRDPVVCGRDCPPLAPPDPPDAAAEALPRLEGDTGAGEGAIPSANPEVV